jgi:N-acetylglucosaminyl-diphospho-decaprenol L-rhamnosyltransferase
MTNADIPDADGIRWPDVSAVIVTYNSAHALADCVARVSGVAETIIVDNASSDGTCDTARMLGGSVRVIENDRNLGFGRANNIGFGAARTPYVLMLNPDALIAADALDALVACVRSEPSVGIAAPVLRNEQGRRELPVMGPREIQHTHLGVDPSGPFCTWFITGAAWMCRTKAWQEIGGFDENIFLYNEDTDFCLRLVKKGYSLVVLPAAVAIHGGGMSSPPSNEVRYLKDWHQTWSHLYINWKYGRAAEARAEARRILVNRVAKALLYVFLLRPSRVAGNWAKASAAWAFLNRKPTR